MSATVRVTAKMSDPRTVNVWHDPDVSCPCVADHNPNPLTFDRHHIVPLSWGGADTPENEIILCPSTHRNAHLLLDRWKRAGGEPSWDVRKLFGPYVRDLAETGWTRWVGAQ